MISRSWRVTGPLLLGALFTASTGCMSSIQQLPPRDNTKTSDKIASTCPEPSETLYAPLRIRIQPPISDKIPRPPFRPPPPRWSLTASQRSPRSLARKLHPLLREWLERQVGNPRETLLVTFRETLRIPTLSTLVETEPRTSPTNISRLASIQHEIHDIEALRDSSYVADSTELVTHFDANVLHRHWLTHSLLVDMPLSRVIPLARLHSVTYIQPRVGNEEPPSCPSSATGNNDARDDPVTARKLIQSDAFRNLGLSYGYMSLLDTGVCTDHCLLDGATFGVAGDCVHGGTDCQTTTASGFDTSDQNASSGGHGTASAALLVGDASMGDTWRGALDITLDYFQVFASGGCGTTGLCLDADAAVHGFENSLSNGDRIIVADLSSLADDWSAVGMSAQNAFDAGAVIIAANGDGGSATSPASAPCAIGAGAFDIFAGATDAAQSEGPSGGRYKPDIQAPSGVETAKTLSSGCGESDLLANHNATSGSTPYAGAAAALLRNWMKASGEFVAPGNVYAGMILAGRHAEPNLNNTEGAGLIELPTDGCAWWGYAVVTTGLSPSFSLDLTDLDVDSLEVAVWWPEDLVVDSGGYGVGQHNNLDLAVYDPSGALAVRGSEVGSVFERVTTSVTRKGVWWFQVSGTSLYAKTALQPFYWMAAAREAR